MKLYSIYDKVAEEFSSPFMAVNDGVAFRGFEHEMSKINPEIRQDYELHFLCCFDTQTGLLDTSFMAGHVVASGDECFKEDKKKSVKEN